MGSKDGEMEFFPPSRESSTHFSPIDRYNNKNVETIKAPVKSLKSISQELGHKTIDILKMDIEGAEYDVIDNLKDQEVEITHRNTENTENNVKPILKSKEILEMQKFNSEIYADDVILKYVASVIDATRNPSAYELELNNIIEFGASPRASIWLIKAAKANAMMNSRGYVIPEDIKEIAHEVLRHRLILTFEAEADEINTDKVIDIILEKIPSP